MKAAPFGPRLTSYSLVCAIAEADTNQKLRVIAPTNPAVAKVFEPFIICLYQRVVKATVIEDTGYLKGKNEFSLS